MKCMLHDGSIRGVIDTDELGKCVRCGRDELVIKIHRLELPNDIEPDDQNHIIARVGDTLGISCGCYATFTRQVLHISKYYEKEVKLETT